MSNKTQRANKIKTHTTNGSHDGGDGAIPVPAIKARVGFQHVDVARDTQELPVVSNGHNGNGHNGNGHNGNGHNGNGHNGNGHNGNGHNGNGKHAANGSNGHSSADGTGNGTARLTQVRPVKVRVGQTGLLDLDYSGHENGNGHNGNGNGHSNGHNGNGNGHKARLMRDTGLLAASVAQRPTTSHLRETDLLRIRYRLGQDAPMLVPAPSRRRSVHRRDLPPFLMRHRTLRSTSRVGYTRSQAAAQRHGKGGAAIAFLRISLAMMLLFTVMFTGGMGAGVAGASLYISQLPPVDPESLSQSSYALTVQTTKFYDRNGILLYDLVDEETGRREELDLKDMSPLVISATIAAEDATFYSNIGIEPVGILRAVSINLSGDGSSGASTITQQVVRQIVLDPDEAQERSWSRKVKEAALAIQLTQTYSKDEILEMYLNQNYYGHRAYGIQAAALTYFNKNASELTLSESALLAGLVQAPSQYDPFINPGDADIRRKYVLDQMLKHNMISEEEYNVAYAEYPSLKQYQVDIKAPHFVYYVKEYLEKKYGPQALDLGLKVYTTIDLRVQEAAEQVARDRIDELRRQKATNAAIVLMKPRTGEILGMVGSVDYKDPTIDGQVNVATRERQPGSSFKPITFAAAFKKGWTPGTVLLDTLTEFPNPGQKPYAPKNYDGRDHGWVTVRESLANSYNVPAVKALQFAGVQETIDTAHAMGIQGLNRGTSWYGLSLTLGGGEVTLLDMTTAYSTFANGGMAVPANPILRIEDAQERTIYQLDPNAPGTQALDPRHSYMITSILSDNKARTPAFGANSPLRTSFQSAAKTGTTDDNRDSWTMGYTPNLTVGVWVGNSDNSEMLKVTGAIGAAVVWHNVMEKFYSEPDFEELVKVDGKVQREFVQPEGLITASACSNKGTVRDLFLKDAPPKGCTTYKDNNKQLRSAPSTNRNNQNQQRRPSAPPTPIPGIGPPSYNP
ncbi:MAG: PBP1A family penicillin-binding protein [Chloroflexota bacterium]|nr:PBP1A family penicillin-binding protein [Chloroflexota bacterium]